MDSPAGVANKTGKDVSITNDQGYEVLEERYVYSGGTNYELIKQTEHDYDGANLVQSKDVLANRVIYDAAYVENEKVSETDETGVVTTYTYDGNGRVLTSTKLGAAGQADIVTTSMRTTDSEGAVEIETVSAGGLSTSQETHYDLAGRVRYQVQMGSGSITRMPARPRR